MKKSPRPRFSAAQFKATAFDSAEVKARFANKLAKFILDDFPGKNFDQGFYGRLSRSFGHIAHFDRTGFYATKFVSLKSKILFIEGLMSYPCHGDPAFTYSDVERAIKAWLRTQPVLEGLVARAEQEIEASERAQLARLMQKYPDACTAQAA